MKNTLIILLLLFYINGFSQKRIKENLISKDQIGLTNSNLKINGFYYTKFIRIRNRRDTIKFIAPIILFKNGAVITSDYLGNGSGNFEKKILGKKNTRYRPF